MPNIATLLKDEITRLARKELRAETEAMKKASAQQRRDIAALKRELSALARKVAKLENRPAAQGAATEEDVSDVRLRFTAKGLKSQRKRLNVSAAEYAKLLGVTPQSVYNWERGVARPQQAQLTALAELRGIGKREVAARLGETAE